MKLEKGLERIRKYFASTSSDQLYKDLVECGLHDLDSWADAGTELAYSPETGTYTLNYNEFSFDADRSLSAYCTELARAA